MLRHVRKLTLLGVISLALLATAVAQDGAPAPPPPGPPRTAADLLDPDLLAALMQMWGPAGPDEPQLTDGGNVTVLSVPDGCAVYVASVEEIAAAGGAGGEATVEAVVFSDEHFLGNTPLTMTVPSGRHVLAVRSTARRDAFDGGCVRKSTYDVITGGRRHAYHLYPLDKKAGQYQCFVANFTDLTERPDDNVLAQAERGTFAVPPDELAAHLTTVLGVADDDLERVATRLNQLGIAPFRKDGAAHLAKLVLVGDGFQLLSWPIAAE